MSNNFLQFSEVVPDLTQEEESWLRSQLTIVAVHGGAETEIDDSDDDVAEDADWVGPRFLRDSDDRSEEGYCDFNYEFGDNSQWHRYLWLYSDGHGDPFQAASLVQKFLKQFRASECWTLGWADFCDKPRVGEFGGGAIFVTADGIEQDWTERFIREETEKFLARTQTANARPAEAVERGEPG